MDEPRALDHPRYPFDTGRTDGDRGYSTNLAEDKEKLRDEWLERLSDLVETIRGWAEELDWSTRRIETKMEDSEIGTTRPRPSSSRRRRSG